MNMAINSKCDYAIDKTNSGKKNISVTWEGVLYLGFMMDDDDDDDNDEHDQWKVHK